MKNYLLLLIIPLLLISCGTRESGVLIAKNSKSLFDDAFCGYETKVVSRDKTGSEQYRIYEQGFSGFVPPSALREDIERQARLFCEDMDKSLKILTETNPPFRMGCYPKAELIFVCLPKEKDPSPQDILYLKLTNLKKLLDSGVITKDEFEQQKSKILNK